MSLGGVVLCVTGTKALFADVGHYSVKSIQISMSVVVYPALLLTYSGQASYLRLHQDDVGNVFYISLPGPLYWPVFAVAVLAAIIASQAMISGTFSIIQQSLALGCFPRVSVVHTSEKHEGQVYIPEVNFLIMSACIIVCLLFRTPEKIGNAYGIAVVLAETITSAFMIIIMLVIWRMKVALVIIYTCCIVSVELMYLTAVLYKFPSGGYFPITFACLLLSVMYIWNHVYRKKYHYEEKNKVSSETLREIITRSDFCRIPRLAIFYSELLNGIPLYFEHYVGNVHALQSVVIFASIKVLHVSTVPSEERFLFRRDHPRDLYVFRCVVSYGYNDAHNEDEPFESVLLEKLKDFVRGDFWIQVGHKEIEQSRVEDTQPFDVVKTVEEWDTDDNVEFVRDSEPSYTIDIVEELEHDSINNNGINEEEMMRANKVALGQEMEVIDCAIRARVVHFIGENDIVSRQGARFGERLIVDYAYNIILKMLRQAENFDIPLQKRLKVGMTYEL